MRVINWLLALRPRSKEFQAAPKLGRQSTQLETRERKKRLNLPREHACCMRVIYWLLALRPRSKEFQAAPKLGRQTTQLETWERESSTFRANMNESQKFKLLPNWGAISANNGA